MNNFEFELGVTLQQVTDLLISAIEGGSNYWYRLENDNDDTSRGYWERVWDSGLKVSDRCADEPYKGEPTEKIINEKTMMEGLQLMQTKYPHHFANVVSDQGDASTGDVFLQLCVFGEIIYG